MHLKIQKSDTVGVALLTLCLAGALWLGHAGWHVSALSGQEFRQAQTGLSIQAMQETGFKLAYDTPVLGKPWSIPMEFPLYQGMVVAWIDLTGDPIPEAGRMVSALGFCFGLVAAFNLLRMVGFSIGACALALCPLVVSPIYLFYSRTVLIESWAWSLATWFLWGICEYRRSRTWKWFLLVWVAGSLAVLVKATTWAVFCLPWAVLFIRDVGQNWRDYQSRLRGWLMEAVGLGLPLLGLGYSWVAYADAVKAENPIGRFLVSSNLTEFNFGTSALMVSADFWEKIGYYTTSGLAPSLSLCGGLILALLWRESRLLLGLGIVAFLGGFLIFSGLYFGHDYYFYANGAFLVVAMGGGVAAGWDALAHDKKQRAALLGLLAMGIYGQLATYFDTYQETQTAPDQADFGLPQVIRALVKPDEVLVAHSPTWNSTIPLYSRRSMLTIPDAQMYFNPDNVTEAIANLEDESVPLVLVIRESRVHRRWVAQRITDFDLWPTPIFTWANDVSAYARQDRREEMLAILREAEFTSVVVDESKGLLPADQRISLTGSESVEKLAQIGITPTEGEFAIRSLSWTQS